MKKAIVAGHVCLDITPAFPAGREGGVAGILQPGKLITMGKADVHTGGAVANTGIAMKILGADVSLIGKVGTDAFGDLIMSILDRHDAGSGMIRTADEASSYTVVLAIPGVDRMFLHNPGTNDSFTADDIPEEALREAALFHFGYPPTMRSMYTNCGEGLLRVMKKAKDAGCVTSLDMTSVDPDSDAGHEDWHAILEKVLPFVDIFVPSIEELCFMLDRPRFEEWQRRAKGGDVTEVLTPDTDIRPLAEECLKLGSRIVMLKCGAPGIFFESSPEEELRPLSESRLELDLKKWSGRNFFERSYVPDRILSGTGCGDVSIAAFMTAMLNGEDAETSLKLAAAEGASCITEYDALSGLLTLDELKKKIDRGWAKN